MRFYALPHRSVLVAAPWREEGVWFSEKLFSYKLNIFRYKLRIQCNVYGHLEASVYAEHVFSENVQTIGIFI